jgi:FAD binding domain in molybdopterin dehydrogenase
MKAAPFEYHAPRTLEEALALLAEFGDEAKVLAGGQSLARCPPISSQDCWSAPGTPLGPAQVLAAVAAAAS